MTTSYLATASGIVSLIFAFWLQTFNSILGQMATNLNAALFVYSIIALTGVGMYNVAKGRNIATGRYNRRNQWTMLALILFVTVALQPYLIQGVYDTSALDLYNAEDMVIADHVTGFGYYNTTPYWITYSSLTETAHASTTGCWTVTLASTAQDNSKRAILKVGIADYSSTASDTWNITAWDQDTDDHIVAYSIRVWTGLAGEPMNLKMGFATDTSYFHDGSTIIYSSETVNTMFYLTNADYEYFDEFATLLSNDQLEIVFWQDDPINFVNGEDIEIEIHFYTESGTTTFDQYLFGAAAINFLIALGMSSVWNPLKGSGRRRFRRRSFRRRRFRRYGNRRRFRRRSFRRRRY